MIGIKHDQEKPKWHLLPLDVIRQVVNVLTFGAKKYKEGNWKKVKPRSRYVSATFRHLDAWQCGEKIDPESGLHHLAHAITNLVFLLWFELHKK